MMKRLLPALTAGALFAITTSAGLMAHARPTQGPVNPGLCPEGWVPATPPLNPQLKCVPNQIQSNPPSRRTPLKKQVNHTHQFAPLPGLCPEGWVPATPPLNPQLGCLPNQMAP